ncbi:hypothetical protein HYS48_02790 [Candidatus Woesearchaeota archaeon]|nr:hypothetical protein [Candidatus Woesearchaeota archaeon]
MVQEPIYTSIIPTIGPSLSEEGALEKAVQAGADGFRLNFAHGTLEEHARVVGIIRERWAEMPILGDLPGGKIRLKDNFPPTVVQDGEIVYLTRGKVGDKEFPIAADEFLWGIFQAYAPGKELYLGDGKLRLGVRKADEAALECEVLAGGGNVIKPRAGLYLPGFVFSIEDALQSDKPYMQFIVEQKIPLVGIPFVLDDVHIATYRVAFTRLETRPSVFAKMEHEMGLRKMDSVITAADIIMVPRGDLGMVVGLEQLPKYQEEIIRKSKERGKPVYVAGRMLESMMEEEIPSEADKQDVEHALQQNVDGLILTDTTAIGKYPIQAIAWLARVREKYREEVCTK